MDRIFQQLRPLIRAVVRHPWRVLLTATALAVVGLLLARNLRIDSDLAQLIPADYPSVRALNAMKEVVGGETALSIGIESPSFDANRAFAEALIPRMLALKGERHDEHYFYRVEYRRDTRFLEENALYFATDEELTRLESYLEEQIEEAILEANPFYFSLEEEDPAPADSTADDLLDAYQRIVGKEYAISEDSTVLVLHFYPTTTQTNLTFIEDVYADTEALVQEMDPDAFFPGMSVSVAGRLLRQLIEVNAITGDVQRSFGMGVTLVLLLVLTYFIYKSVHSRRDHLRSWRQIGPELARAPFLAVLIGLPLLMGLSWTYGLAYLTLDSLNLMTSTLGLVIFGLGIDFGIHFYARYAEERALGRGISDAAETTFASTGQAITAGALTTAGALFILMAADFRGFSEFGFMAGTGILFALVSMVLVLPALLAVFESLGVLRFGSEAVPRAMPRASGGKPRRARWVIAGSLLAVFAALALLPTVEFEFDFGKLEPTLEEYEERQEPIWRVVGSTRGRRNPAYVLVDDPEAVPAVVKTLKDHVSRDTLSPTIRSIESLQDRFPMTPADQERKLEQIRKIRALLDGSVLQDSDSPQLEELRRASSTDSALALADVPGELRRQFTTKSGTLGNFVIIYPSLAMADGRNSMAFAEDVGRIVTDNGQIYHAASSSLVAADMLRLMMAEAPWMIVATFVIVAMLMLLNFRSIQWAILAMLPLMVGVLWMLFLMEVFDLRLNFYNLVVLPVILGIGNDAGVHLVQRYREEGPGALGRVLRSTGEHVAMASITTMVGFGGLLLSFHPGLNSIGQVAVAGIGSTLLAALMFLPALLRVLEDRSGT